MRSALLILVAFWSWAVEPAAAPADAATAAVVSVADFGAVPGDGQDDTEAVRQALAKCQARQGSTLVFPTGIYDFTAARLLDHQRVFSLAEADGLTIDGQGSEFFFDGLCTPFHVERSRGVTLRRFAIDWRRPPYAQGVVTAVDGWSLDVALDPGFTADLKAGVYAFMDYDRSTGLPIGSVDVFASGCSTAAVTGPGSYRLVVDPAKVQASERDRLLAAFAGLIGRTLVIRHHPALFDCWGLDFVKCAGTLVEDVDIYTCVGLGYHDSQSTDVTCRRLRIAPRAGSGRLMSSTLDGWHCSFMAGRVLIEDCVFQGMGDDGINIYSKYLAILGTATPTTVLAKVAMRGWRGPTPRPGEVMELSGGDELRPVAHLTVKNAAWEADHNLYRLEFTTPLPTAAASDLLGNLTYSPQVTIRNCQVGANRARGILISTPDALIEGCTIARTTCAGRMIFAEPRRQARVPSGVVVRNNSFVDCGATAIYAYVRGAGAKPAASRITGVRILDNRISLSPEAAGGLPRQGFPVSVYWSAGISLASTDAAELRGNTITGPFAPAIAIGFSTGTVIEGNRAATGAQIRLDGMAPAACRAEGNEGLALVGGTLADQFHWREHHFANIR